MRALLRVLLPFGLLGVIAAPSLAEEFSARLGRVPVDTRTQAAISGLGRATGELEGNRLTIAGDFAGMLGPATAANLHLGIATGARGPVIHPLEVDAAAEGRLRGSVELTDDQVAALRAGRLYVQIASEPAPDGNLWGWLLVD